MQGGDWAGRSKLSFAYVRVYNLNFLPRVLLFLSNYN